MTGISEVSLALAAMVLGNSYPAGSSYQVSAVAKPVTLIGDAQRPTSEEWAAKMVRPCTRTGNRQVC